MCLTEVPEVEERDWAEAQFEEINTNNFFRVIK